MIGDTPLYTCGGVIARNDALAQVRCTSFSNYISPRCIGGVFRTLMRLSHHARNSRERAVSENRSNGRRGVVILASPLHFSAAYMEYNLELLISLRAIARGGRIEAKRPTMFH